MNDKINKIFNMFNDYEIYMVGGSVRDFLMNKTPKDIDFCTSALPKEIIEIGNKNGINTWFCDNGLLHGTVVFNIGGENFEITTFRRDVSTDGRNATVEFAKSLKEDVSRRDFTINAMAMDVNGNVFDFFGGQEDIKNKVIRFVGNAKKRIKEDYLRMLRAIRFASRYGFELDVTAEGEIINNRFKVCHLSKERIRLELFNILENEKPSLGFEMLSNVGLLLEILPEIEIMRGMHQRSDYHHKDVFGHEMIVLDNMAEKTDDVLMRFVALLHDVGKPVTRSFTEGIGYQFLMHEIEGAKIAEKICKRFKMSLEDISLVKNLIWNHLRLVHLSEGKCSDKSIRRLLRESFEIREDFFDKLVLLTRADRSGHNPEKIKREDDQFNNFMLHVEKIKNEVPVEKIASPLDGNEIMNILGVGPCRKVGEVKNFLIEKVEEGVLLFEEKEKAEKMIKEVFLV